MLKDLIRVYFDKIPKPVLNTARDYQEGRDLIITYLVKSTRLSEVEIVNWLKNNNISVKDLSKYKVKNNII